MVGAAAQEIYPYFKSVSRIITVLLLNGLRQ